MSVMRERYTDALERIREIPAERSVERPFRDYFRSEAGFILELDRLIEPGSAYKISRAPIDRLMEVQRLFKDMLYEEYPVSYLNPEFSRKELGEYGGVLSALSMELRGLISECFYGRLDRLTKALELFIEIYCMFEVDNEDIPTERAVRDCIYSYCYDYSEELQRAYIERRYTLRESFLKELFLSEDYDSTDYLYRTGEYVSEESLREAENILSLDDTELDRRAELFSKALLESGAVDKGMLISIAFPAGHERIVKRAAEYFKKAGIDFNIQGRESSMLMRFPGEPTGYYISPNPKADRDHAYDLSLVMGDRIAGRLLEERVKLMSEYEEELCLYGGRAVLSKETKPCIEAIPSASALSFSPHQAEVYKGLLSRLKDITEKYIRRENIDAPDF